MTINSDEQFADLDGEPDSFPWDDDETQEEALSDQEYEDQLLKRYGINLTQHWE